MFKKNQLCKLRQSQESFPLKESQKAAKKEVEWLLAKAAP